MTNDMQTILDRLSESQERLRRYLDVNAPACLVFSEVDLLIQAALTVILRTESEAVQERLKEKQDAQGEEEPE